VVGYDEVVGLEDAVGAVEEMGKGCSGEVGDDSGEMRGSLHSSPRLALLARGSGRDDVS
jgi:hypothetical protein